MKWISVERHLSERELEGLIRQVRDKRFLERLVFIRDLYDGGSVERAAGKLGRVKATGYSWLERWNAGGLEGLKPDFKKAGRPPKLSAEERDELKEMLLTRDDWTTREVRSLIRERFGVEYSTRSVYRVLRALGMRYGKPYPRDYRRPEDAEERLRRKVRKALKGEERALLGFLDECRPQTDSNTSRVWSLRRPRTRKNTSIYRANTFGFYSPVGRSVIGFKENSKKESVCGFLEEVRASNPGGRILVILDNFPSHRARRTRERAEELGMRLVYLPPYSPDLNPIEQIWRGLKRRISTAFFRTREEFLELIEDAYHNLSNKVSYARGWNLKFMPGQFNQLCL